MIKALSAVSPWHFEIKAEGNTKSFLDSSTVYFLSQNFKCFSTRGKHLKRKMVLMLKQSNGNSEFLPKHILD